MASRSRRRRPTMWTEGMRPCQSCGGSHLDIQCPEQSCLLQTAAPVSRPTGRRTRRPRVSAWSEDMRGCQFCGGSHLDRNCSWQEYQPEEAAPVSRLIGAGRRARRRRVSSWAEGMRACKFCAGQHLDCDCSGHDLEPQAAALASRPTSAGRRRRRGATVWSEGMRACQCCGGQHLDRDCTVQDSETKVAVLVSRPAGRRARRRGVTTWSEGMRACQHCGGLHLDRDCSAQEGSQEPESRATAGGARPRGVLTWSEGMRACQHCGGKHLDMECEEQAVQLTSAKLPKERLEDEHVCFIGACGFMGLSPAKYAKSFDVIELDLTFHDQSDHTYEEQAAQYKQLGLHVMVKVSRYATHDCGLQNPGDWWSWLKSKYQAFADAGILVGLLWQLPPTFTKTEANLNNLGRLGAQIRSARQGKRWQQMNHVFEFRDSSWFDDEEVAATMDRHKLTLATSHFVNETGWAGNLVSGWHGPVKPHTPPAEEAANFVYMRCLGTDGRSIGSYSVSELHDVADMVKDFSTAVVVFGQGDAPPQVIDNATKLRSILDTGVPKADMYKETEINRVVTGTVIASITKGWNRHADLDVEGRKGYLGYRHLQKKGGFDLKVGQVLEDLHIEADDGQRLYLSAPELVHTTVTV
eukprot:gb/GFBE01073901.1/.p1 GENE.gb/GFBE01073901.1/~~gb/GFBE01073901.1/.p1  ORF type:complete len:637 (+),score=102.45 gb/GFBE01073901.1/:1-1911(+)